MANRFVTSTWVAPTTGGQVDSYNIWRANVADGIFAKIGNSATTTFDDHGVVEGSSYNYYVTSMGPGGESGPSNVVLTPIPFRAPGEPTNLVCAVN